MNKTYDSFINIGKAIDAISDFEKKLHQLDSELTRKQQHEDSDNRLLRAFGKNDNDFDFEIKQNW